MNNATQIVLLGGGYASIWAYRSLIKELHHEMLFGEVRIIVICPDDYHFFHGWTAESLTGIVQDRNRMSPLAELLSKALLIKGYANEINCEDNLVYVKTETGTTNSIHFDHLLIGIGAYDCEQIDGIMRAGYQVKSHAAFLHTKKNIQLAVAKAAQLRREDAEKLLRFTICGGGFSGIEMAANIAEFLTILTKQYSSLENVKPTIRLVHSKETVLDGLNPRFEKIRAYTEKVLGQSGIEMINNKKVTKITTEGAFLSDNSCLESSMVISTIGQSRICLKGTEGWRRDGINRLCTNSFLQIQGYQNIWGGGDACSVPYRKTKNPCIPNALWAIKHGEYAGKNIARTIRQESLKSFDYKGLGQCASLGIGKGMGELYGFQFTGWIAWITRWLFFNYFMPSRKVMIKEIADWMYLLFFGRRKGLKIQEQFFTFNRSLNPILQPGEKPTLQIENLNSQVKI